MQFWDFQRAFSQPIMHVSSQSQKQLSVPNPHEPFPRRPKPSTLQGPFPRYTLALAMTFFGSRIFLRKLLKLHRLAEREQGQRFTGGLTSNFDEFLRRILRECACPSDVFSASFQSSRVRRNAVKKAPKRKRVKRVLGLWRAFFKRAGRAPEALLSPGRTRRELQVDLADRMGTFTGKNCYQILKKFYGGHRRAFKRSLCRARRFSLCGPGARAALNLLEGWPKLWNDRRKDEQTHYVYSGVLVRWQIKFNKVCRSVIGELPEELRTHVDCFLAFGERDFQFFLSCPGS